MKRLNLSLPEVAVQSNFAHVKMRLANKGRGDFRAEGNTIWIYDAIAGSAEEAAWFGGIAPTDFISQLSAMSGDVTLRINSPGGSVFGAQAMVTAIRQYKGKVTAQVDSLAASAASVIAVNCAECIMAPGAMMMIHKAWGMVVGNETDMLATADLLGKLDGTIAASYAKKSGCNQAEALAMMAAETWFTAQEAIDAKLCDGILGEDAAAPQARWDLSAFANAPQMAAAPTNYNDADVAFVTDMIGMHEQCIAKAKAVLVAGADEEIAGMAGEAIGDATECLCDLREWLGEKGIGPAMPQQPEDKIDVERAMRMRMAEAALLSAPI